MVELDDFKRYRIGEAAKLLDVKTSVLRFWEGEFDQLEPVRTDSGQRLYTEQNIRLLWRIKKLLHEEGLTIEGARKRLSGEDRPDVKPDQSFLREILAELNEIRLLADTMSDTGATTETGANHYEID